MSKSVDLFYIDIAGEVISSEQLPFEELFLRKLVDATIVRNQMWEHQVHEMNDERQAAIYVTLWEATSMEQFGTEIANIIHEKFDVSTYYEIQWFHWEGQRFTHWQSEPTTNALHPASVLLDHTFVVAGRQYKVQYAVLDLDRRKLLMFLV